jgi:hypothetical protein
MSGDTPDITGVAAPDEAGLDNALAALRAISDSRSCGRQVGELRQKFGACDAQQESMTALVTTAKRKPKEPTAVAVMTP